MFGSFAVDQGELNHLPFDGGQHRIDLAVDGAADPDIHHATFRDSGAQGVSRVGQIRDVGAGCALRRLGRGRLRCGCGRARRWLLRGRCGGLSAACEKRDHVGAVVIGLETRKRHLVARHDLRRIGQILIERLGIPNDVSRLHRGGIVESGFRACLASNNAGKRRTEQVLAGLNRMARLTFPEDKTPCPGIARGLRCVGLRRRLPGRSTCRRGATRCHVVMSGRRW